MTYVHFRNTNVGQRRRKIDAAATFFDEEDLGKSRRGTFPSSPLVMLLQITLRSCKNTLTPLHVWFSIISGLEVEKCRSETSCVFSFFLQNFQSDFEWRTVYWTHFLKIAKNSISNDRKNSKIFTNLSFVDDVSLSCYLITNILKKNWKVFQKNQKIKKIKKLYFCFDWHYSAPRLQWPLIITEDNKSVKCFIDIMLPLYENRTLLCRKISSASKDLRISKIFCNPNTNVAYRSFYIQMSSVGVRNSNKTFASNYSGKNSLKLACYLVKALHLDKIFLSSYIQLEYLKFWLVSRLLLYCNPIYYEINAHHF